MIFEATDIDNRVFEIKVQSPSWQLAKYVLDNYDMLSKKDDPNVPGVAQVYDDLLKECVVSWREITKNKNSDWCKDYKQLPAPVSTGIVMKLIVQSQNVAEVRITTEKK